MKTTIFLLLAVFGLEFLWAQKGDKIPLGVVVMNPPKAVKNKFETDHPNVHATWEMELANYLADYTDKTTNTEYNVIYDKHGNLIRTDRVLDETSYPEPIENYHAQYYPGEKYKVWHSEDSTGKKSYYSKHKWGTNWFDENGSHISTDSKSNENK